MVDDSSSSRDEIADGIAAEVPASLPVSADELMGT